LEERKNEQGKYYFNVAMATHTNLPERDGFHLIREGNLAVFYPKQSEDRPEEDGVLSNAEMDKMNDNLARSFFPFFTNVHQSLLSLDWSQSIDFAVTMEDRVLYVAFA